MTTADNCGPHTGRKILKYTAPPPKILKDLLDICFVAEASPRRDRFF